MNVKELIEKLNAMPQDADVCMVDLEPVVYAVEADGIVYISDRLPGDEH